ncbi:cation diffusion facilitator family transporter [Novosphingobium beihaiensis]|uniref:Cation diffusion facilitator family transporter n=1 Tax=Novosphingobium beihaiensis TaxID=2930389 RepID=A0ABT0BR30_9SPHN|nr:cation diffusion facilitator family transporter [Novosphingobium beihaiensis]MCJ2187433.1 cation diffusion facilitator family transporter [Novosphingobium beihaiensis]
MTGHARLNHSAAIASISAALLLLGIKGWAAWSTGSTAMLGSLADTTLDLVASLATLLGVWIAAQPADDKHRFGHGKAEAIAALFQIVLISISALGIASRAVEQFLAGSRVEAAAEGIGVSLAAIAVTFALLAWQRHVIRKTGSLAISTDNVHYQSDLLLNLAVIVALALDQYAGFKGADPLFGLGIAAWLGWGARRASSQVIDQLMDHEWPKEKKRRFLEVLASYPDITGVHDLRTRTSGNKDFVQFHIWVDPKMTVWQAHRVMDDIESRIHAEFPDIEVLIHTDPEGLVNEAGNAGRNVLLPIRARAE